MHWIIPVKVHATKQPNGRRRNTRSLLHAALPLPQSARQAATRKNWGPTVLSLFLVNVLTSTVPTHHLPSKKNKAPVICL